jgi:hypothetical protein
LLPLLLLLLLETSKIADVDFRTLTYVLSVCRLKWKCSVASAASSALLQQQQQQKIHSLAEP